MYRYLILVFVLTTGGLKSQIQGYEISLNPLTINDWLGAQSFAYGVYGDDILIIGGRVDGLHRRQPWASFDVANRNLNLTVINTHQNQTWSWPIQNLDPLLMEQLSSTNLNFYQDGASLILLGGYGYSETFADHTTFEMLTIVDLPQIIQAIKNGGEKGNGFSTIMDESFAVTGGRLLKLEDTYYLVGGQRFEGRYNPMNHPTFTQTYTNAVRRFKLIDKGGATTVEWLTEFNDADLLHRRDLNVAPIITQDGNEAIMAYSGVFRVDVDLPYHNLIFINENGPSEVPNIEQIYNHYHSAHFSWFDASTTESGTVFFGGMAQYYMEGNQLIKDDNVPFVRTISSILRNEEGEYYEEIWNQEMPGFLGASAEFIVNPNVPLFGNGVINWNELQSDEISLGYIVGGIESTDRNIFFTNDGSQSKSSTLLFEVKATKMSSSSIDRLNELQFFPFPNPTNGQITVNVSMPMTDVLEVFIQDTQGHVLANLMKEKVSTGWHSYNLELPINLPNAEYIITARSADKIKSIPVILSK